MTSEQKAGADKVEDFLHVERADYQARMDRERMEQFSISARIEAMKTLTQMHPRRTDGATYTPEDFIADADKLARWAVSGTVPERPKVQPNDRTDLS